MIVKGFKECGYIEYHGQTESLHSNLRRTVEEKNVPQTLVDELNAQLAVMESDEVAENTERELVFDGEENNEHNYPASGSDDSDSGADCDVRVRSAISMRDYAQPSSSRSCDSSLVSYTDSSSDESVKTVDLCDDRSDFSDESSIIDIDVL